MLFDVNKKKWNRSSARLPRKCLGRIAPRSGDFSQSNRIEMKHQKGGTTYAKSKQKSHKLNWNFACSILEISDSCLRYAERVHWAVSNFRSIWSQPERNVGANIWAYNNNVVESMMDDGKGSFSPASAISSCRENSCRRNIPLIRSRQDQQAFAFQRFLTSDVGEMECFDGYRGGKVHELITPGLIDMSSNIVLTLPWSQRIG